MRTLSLAFVASLSLIVITFTLPADQAAQAKKTDAEKLIGTWRVVQGRCDGEDLPKEFLSLMRLKFDKEGFSQFSVGSRETIGTTFKISGRDKIEIALGVVGSLNLVPALYKLEVTGQLAICADLDSNGPRPTFFTAEKGSGRILLILDRATRGQEALLDTELAKHRDTVDNLKGFERLQENLRRWESADNLYLIHIGFYSYSDDKGKSCFPAQAIYSKDGKTPLLSWRVALLQNLPGDELNLGDFRLDEPWDSEHNKKLIPKMPSVFAGPGQDKKLGLTYYQVFTGSGTLFQGNKKPDLDEILKMNRVNAALVAEAGKPVIWTKPEDIEMPTDKTQAPALGGLLKNGMNVLLVSPDVEFLRKDELSTSVIWDLIKGRWSPPKTPRGR